MGEIGSCGICGELRPIREMTVSPTVGLYMSVSPKPRLKFLLIFTIKVLTVSLMCLKSYLVYLFSEKKIYIYISCFPNFPDIKVVILIILFYRDPRVSRGVTRYICWCDVSVSQKNLSIIIPLSFLQPIFLSILRSIINFILRRSKVVKFLFIKNY
jgi:hypothetical protein